MKSSLIVGCLITPIILIASPATATVFLTCTDLGNGVIELSYDASEEEERVRCFALDITVSSGVIASIGNWSSHYWVFTGSIYIEHGEVVELGTPICEPSRAETLSGLGTSGMTIEMGSLYVGEANAPPPIGVLLTFIISAECDITVEENAVRGGVILEDGYTAPVYAPVLQGALPPEPGTYGGGTGSANDPFLIFDANQMNTIGANPGDLHKHFKLMADIDLSCYTGTDFNIIGTYFGNPFMGVFDGNNHDISNFTYSCPDSNFIGLFGYIDNDNAMVKNLDLTEPNVNAGSGDNVGSLIGYLRRGTVSQCGTQGGTVSGDDCIGGLVGRNFKGTIINCYANNNILGNVNLGGLVGRTYVEISNCYASSNVFQDANIAGGFAGYNYGNIASSFWDEQTSGQAEGVAETGESAVTEVTGKSTAQMQMKNTFVNAGWDFKGESNNGTEDIWTICQGKTYPRLVRQRFIGDFIGLDAVDMADFAVLASAWRSEPGDGNWNQFCDISDPNDGVIDEQDLSVFVHSWLKGIP